MSNLSYKIISVEKYYLRYYADYLRYYADQSNNCQLFHICMPIQVSLLNIIFLSVQRIIVKNLGSLL